MKVLFRSLITGLVLTLPGIAHATFIDRGDGLIYDDVLDVTWLADANLAQTEAFGVGGITPDGLMSWTTANDWITALNAGSFKGLDNWRLPATTQPDPTCSLQNTGGIAGQGGGFNCTGSEMGHLYNVGGVTSADPGPFINVQSGDYWSQTEFAPNPTGVWAFVFGPGIQATAVKDVSFLFAWALRDGDVQSVMEAPTRLLLVVTCLALAGLGGCFTRAATPVLPVRPT